MDGGGSAAIDFAARFRGDRAGSIGGGNLRGHIVFGGAADKRNRNSRGSGRQQRQFAGPGVARRDVDAADGPGDWAGGLPGVCPLALDTVVWNGGLGYSDYRNGGSVAGWGWTACHLHSGSPRRACGPLGGATLRVSDETFGESNCPIFMSEPKQPRPEKVKTPDSIEPEHNPDDEVDESGEESFPASDSPPWTG